MVLLRPAPEGFAAVGGPAPDSVRLRVQLWDVSFAAVAQKYGKPNGYNGNTDLPAVLWLSLTHTLQLGGKLGDWPFKGPSFPCRPNSVVGIGKKSA